MVTPENTGRYIKEVRTEKGLTQRALAKKCGFSDTVLSGYENGKIMPSVITLANIAEQLGVSIDRLVYGDDNNAFIKAVPDIGRKVVNAVYFLWEIKVLNYCEGVQAPEYLTEIYENGEKIVFLAVYTESVIRLLKNLDEFSQNKDTYVDPEAYIEMLLSSVAKEINNKIDEKERERILREELLKHS